MEQEFIGFVEGIVWQARMRVVKIFWIYVEKKIKVVNKERKKGRGKRREVAKVEELNNVKNKQKYHESMKVQDSEELEL